MVWAGLPAFSSGTKPSWMVRGPVPTAINVLSRAASSRRLRPTGPRRSRLDSSPSCLRTTTSARLARALLSAAMSPAAVSAYVLARSAASSGSLAVATTSTTSVSLAADTVTSSSTSTGDSSTPCLRSSSDVASATRRESTVATLFCARLSASGAVGGRPSAVNSGPIVWLNSSLAVDS